MALRSFSTFLLCLGLGFVSSRSLADSDFLNIDPDIVCRRTQAPKDWLCPKLEHLRLRFNLDWGENAEIRLAYDPHHVAKVTWMNTWNLGVQKLPPQQSWLDDYAIRMAFDTEWELSLEDWRGATLLPDASGLGFAHALQDTGWNQTALRLSWINPDLRVLAASLIIGQGEGKRLEEEDSQPYFGALTRIELAQALSLQLGLSYDPDSLAKDSLFWVDNAIRSEAAKDFQASRQAISLFFDGSHAYARGLRFSLGWQRNQIRGPPSTLVPLALDPIEGPLDPTELLAEMLGGRSKLDRKTWALSASYTILAEYVLAFHLQNLNVDLGDQNLLRACSNLDSGGHCLDEVSSHQSLAIRATTIGFGKKSEHGWSLMLESFQQRYDRLYEMYHFAPGADQRQQSLQLLQLRLSWLL